jgi:hypothetical protein
MLIFTRTGATAIADPEYGQFEAGDAGEFDVPDDLAQRLLAFHTRGKPQWEDEIGRQQRLVSEELKRRQDPSTLLTAVEQIINLAAAGGAAQAQAQASAPAPAAAKPARKTTATAAAGDGAAAAAE